ncbi:MAG: DUF5661 family protein [Candidatus Paceibacterota bacterium]
MQLNKYIKLAVGELEDRVSEDVAREVGEAIGIDWDEVEFTPKDLAAGMMVELEHGSKDANTDVTGDDLEMTAKIAWAHLKESPKYYKLLDKMEKDF